MLGGAVLVGVGLHRAGGLASPHDGTLFVEVVDPRARVAILGQDIVCVRAGPTEERLLPGRSEVWCSWKGWTGPSEWVTLRPDDEAEARPLSLAPNHQPSRPFVLLGRGDQP